VNSRSPYALVSVPAAPGLLVAPPGSPAFYFALAFSALGLVAAVLSVYDYSINVRRNRREFREGR
jgi:hypothetical protein